MRLLIECQKFIKIADRSKYGWGVVAEYTVDELAEDRDDVKHLEKAEKAAERKATKRKPTTKTGKGRYSTQPPGPSGSTPVSAAMPYAPYPPKWPQLLPALMLATGPCFACGEIGYLRTRQCQLKPGSGILCAWVHWGGGGGGGGGTM